MARPGETIGSPYSRQGEVHVVEDRRIPSYRVGDMMEAEIRFEYEPGLQEIVAFFIHLGDPYVHTAIVGDVRAGAGDVGTAHLQGVATVIENAYGEYRCVSIHGEHADGRRIWFEPIPDIRFNIVRDLADPTEQARSRPLLQDWSWV
jgi:hypothetical protein